MAVLIWVCSSWSFIDVNDLIVSFKALCCSCIFSISLFSSSIFSIFSLYFSSLSFIFVSSFLYSFRIIAFVRCCRASDLSFSSFSGIFFRLNIFAFVILSWLSFIWLFGIISILSSSSSSFRIGFWGLFSEELSIWVLALVIFWASLVITLFLFTFTSVFLVFSITFFVVDSFSLHFLQ